MDTLTEVLSQKLNMGGYAAYVWPSFAIAAIAMAAMMIVSIHSLRKAEKTLSQLQRTSGTARPQ